MAITESTVFDKVIIWCSCDNVQVSGIAPFNGTSPAIGAEAIQSATTDTDQIAQLDIMRDAVIAGDAVVVYQDGANNIAYDDLPFEHSLVHTLHSIHPEGGWKALGTMVRNADVTEDDDTGRSDLETQFGIVPSKRKPDGDTFSYPLDRWNVRLLPDSHIGFQRDWTEDDNVTAPNDDDDVVGMLAWLESIRTTGDAVGDSILAIDDLSGRTYQIDQGTGFPTLDLEITIRGHQVTDGVYSHVSFSMQRVTSETDEVHIDAIRTIIAAATGSITVASDDAPEEPPFGSTSVRIKAKDIELPDGKVVEVVGDRIVLRQPSLGRTPLDGSGRRIVRYDDLESFTNLSKYMPTDGSRVVHFGHGATSMGNLVFRDIAEHTLSENVGEVYEVRNISSEQDVEVHDPDGGVLINLKPGQQCSFELAEENADGDEEIIAINPPIRRLLWQRGLALPNFAGQNLYSADATGWLSLPWPVTSGLKYRDEDAFEIGNASRSSQALVSNVPSADWDIPGSFQILKDGLVRLDLRYHLLLNEDPPTDLEAVLTLGHGMSLWISEGGTEAMTRQGYVGLPEISAIGDIADCGFRYLGSHTANTRFLMLHRIPTGSVLGTDDDADAYYDQIDLEAVTTTAELEPIIRWTNS